MGLICVCLAFLSAAATSAAPPASALQPVQRKVYVTIMDGNGAPVTDLTAADFTLKEGGKEREIVKAEPASAKMRLAILVEERLLGDTSIRLGIFEFAKRMQPYSEMALVTVGLRNNTLVDYTSDLNVLVDVLNRLSLSQQPQSNFTEGVLDLAKAIEKERPERPVIVAVALAGGQAGGASANEVLNQLRQSTATMYSISLGPAGQSSASSNVGAIADESNREQVLGDGAKQSGGRRIEAVATAAVGKAMQQIATELGSQYVIRYTLPDGVKPNKALNLSVKRKGITMRAPSGLPDR
jgi:VWFA-related protein